MNKNPNTKNEDEDSGTGAKGGAIEFHDFITPNQSKREENMPPDEVARLRAVHKANHEAIVKKQQALRQYREDLKNKKISMETHRENQANEMNSNYPAHPILSNKAQFSGIDKQENQVPTMSETQTNDENRNELELGYKLKHQPEMGKKFHPKPQYP